MSRPYRSSLVASQIETEVPEQAYFLILSLKNRLLDLNLTFNLLIKYSHVTNVKYISKEKVV